MNFPSNYINTVYELVSVPTRSDEMTGVNWFRVSTACLASNILHGMCQNQPGILV